MDRAISLALALCTAAILGSPSAWANGDKNDETTANATAPFNAAQSSFDDLISLIESGGDESGPQSLRVAAIELKARLDGNGAAISTEQMEKALTTLASAWQKLGNLDEERLALERAKTYYMRDPAANRANLFTLANSFASVSQREGRVGEGEKLLRQSLAALDPASKDDQDLRQNGLSFLAEYLEDASRLEGAAQAYRELLDFQSRKTEPDPDDILQTTSKLTWVLGRLGRYTESVNLLRPAITRAEAAWRATGASETKNGTMESMGFAMLQANLQTYLADHLGALGQIEESDAYFKLGLKLRQRYSSRPTFFVARSYNAMAYRQNFQGRYEEAEINARTALEIYESMGDFEDDIVHAKYQYNLASALLGQGKADDAIPYLKAAVPIQRKLFADDHPDLVILLSTLARALSQTEDGKIEALAFAREAATIARKHRDARVTGGYADSVPDPQSAALSRALAGDTSTHDPLAMAYGAMLEAAWASPSGNDKASELQLNSEAFVAAQDIEQSAAGQAMAEAAARALGGTGELGKLIATKQALTARVRAANAALAQALGSLDQQRIEMARNRLNSLSSELAAIDANIRAKHPDFDALVTPTAQTLAQVRAHLAPDEALLLMVPDGTRIYIFAVSQTALSLQAVSDDQKIIGRAVKMLRCRVDEASCTNPEDMDQQANSDAALTGIDAYFPRFNRLAAYSLYANLIKPVEAGFGGAKRIYVTIGGDLSGLPLSLLVTKFDPERDDAEAGTPADLQGTQWLGDKYAFVSLPSVASLKAHRAQAGKAKPSGKAAEFLGYGAPQLSGDAGQNRSVEASGRRRLRSGVLGTTRSLTESLRALAPLPGTEVELKGMARALNSPAESLKLGAAATEAALRADPQLARAKVIAFATHGLLPREVGVNAEPGLVFTPPAQASANDDGLLTASEAAQLPLDADWVVLSACNTASSDGTPGAQSLSGLGRAFLYAGARALLASHWRVSDDVTAALTVETLSLSRIAKMPRAEALQQAMKSVRTGKRADGSAMPGWQPHWAHPSAWAPFILVAADGG
jgi:CHAT domain-containing protein